MVCVLMYADSAGIMNASTVGGCGEGNDGSAAMRLYVRSVSERDGERSSVDRLFSVSGKANSAWSFGESRHER